MQMHPRAPVVFALVFLAAGCVNCEDKTRWYSGLRAVLNNCPLESWTNSGPDDFLETFRKCVQEHALAALDSLLVDDIIPVFDGLDLVRYHQPDWAKPADNYTDR